MRSPPFMFVRSVLVRDWRFLSLTVVSCIVAATVATFQVAVYNSFLAASAVVPRAIGADFWVKAHGVDCFDFPAPFSEDYAGALARYFPAATMQRIVFGFVPWRSPTGRQGNVALIGIEGSRLGPTGFLANASDLKRLDIVGYPAPVDATIGGETLAFERKVDNLATYLGAPYVVTDFATARRLLRMDPTSTAFLAGRFAGPPPAQFEHLAAQAKRDFPDIQVVSAEHFLESSRVYWQRKTGAGLAIALAAVLASLLMVILFANGVLRFIQRYHSDLLSLLGHGASTREIGAIVFLVAVVIGAATLTGSAMITPAIVASLKGLLPWVSFRGPDLLVPLLGVCTAIGAAMMSVRSALEAFGPEAVFRS